MTQRKLTAAVLTGLTVLALSQNAFPAEKLSVAYQHGLAYAPVMIMKEQGLIEKNFEGEVEVEWTQLNSGAAINEAFASGQTDVGQLGVAPFITGVTAGIPYKMYGTLSAQPHKLMTNQEDIQSMADITAEDKIALVNIGSIQHIMLGMASAQVLGDAHVLDTNITAMSHPDGMAALLSGSVNLQLTTSPYIFIEEETGSIHEVKDFADAWPADSAFIIGLVSNKLCEERPELYQAVVSATQEAIDYIYANPEEAAQIVAAQMNQAPEDVQSWMMAEGSRYDMHLTGIMEMASFMEEAGFLEAAPESMEEICTPEALTQTEGTDEETTE